MKPKFEDVEREIRRLAHEHPDRTARACYELNGEPCCIFGHAFYNLGIPVETLDDWDRKGGFDATDPTDFTGVEHEGFAKRWLRHVQGNNDEGHTFSRAVADSDDWLFRHG